MSTGKPVEVMNAAGETVRAVTRDAAPPPRLGEMLDVARRHVINGKRAIVEQRDRVETLRREGRESAEAERRLADLEATMQSMQEHVANDDEARGKQKVLPLEPLEQAHHDVSDAVHRVAVQHARVERMRRSGHDTRAAEEVLAVCHAILRAMRDRLSQEKGMTS